MFNKISTYKYNAVTAILFKAHLYALNNNRDIYEINVAEVYFKFDMKTANIKYFSSCENKGRIQA